MISVCMITKNEKEKLNRALRSLSQYELEVVVVDTGSDDGTMEMLAEWQGRADKAFTLATGYFAWCGDFSKARNYSVSLAGNDRIFVLDSDESVLRMDLAELERLMEANPDKVGIVSLRDRVEVGGIPTYKTVAPARLFDRRYFHYDRRIHEQICYNAPGREHVVAEGYYTADVLLDHDGYVGTPEERLKKPRRNIELLEKELSEKGETPFILYNLGKNYTWIGESDRAIDAFLRAMAYDLDPEVNFVQDMVESYGYLLVNSGRAQEALGLANISGEFGHAADFHLMLGHVYMHNLMFDLAIEEFLAAAGCEFARVDGANSFIAYYNAGVVYECTGRPQEALKLYRRCGGYPAALSRIAAMEGE